MVNASWPLATLNVSRESMDLKVAMMGEYSFTPGQVVNLEPCGVLPVIGKGVRIHHNVPEYPKKIIFWCVGNPEKLLDRIKGTGFLPVAPYASMPGERGMPVRVETLGAAIAVWCALFLLDFTISSGAHYKPGWWAFLAVSSACALSIGALRNEFIQRIFLMPGRSIHEIKPVLRLFALISGIMSLGFFVTNLPGFK
jgi:hypothetical protein